MLKIFCSQAVGILLARNAGWDLDRSKSYIYKKENNHNEAQFFPDV